MGRVIIVGAGASAGTLSAENAPICRDFGKVLQRKVPRWRVAYPNLSSCVEYLCGVLPGTDPGDWSLDRVWGAIDNQYKLFGILHHDGFPDRSTIVCAGFELKKAVCAVYGDQLRERIDQAARGNGTLKAVLGATEPNDCIVSLNYDNLVERLLSALGKEFVQPKNERSSFGDGLILVKPHGSLTWWRRLFGRGTDEIEIRTEPLRESEIQLPGNGKDVEVQPGIIGPVPHKTELLYEQRENLSRLVQAHWSLARRSFASADVIDVVGYSFPEEDDHAMLIFQRAAYLSRERRGGPVEVRVYQRDEGEYERVRENLKRNVFHSSEANYSFRGPVRID